MILNFANSLKPFFILCILLTLSMISVSHAVTTNTIQLSQTDDEVETTDVVLLEIQGMRAELSELNSAQQLQIEGKAEIINDRLAALDRRLLTIEGRVNTVLVELNAFELNLAIAVGMMLAIALITVVSLVFIRRKAIDPVHVQIAALKTSLENQKPETAGDAEKLKLAIQDLAKDDPYLAQILKRHHLI